MIFHGIGCEAMAYAMPARRVAVDELVRNAGFDGNMAMRLRDGGLRQVPAADGAPLPDLVRQAIRNLATLIPTFAARTAGMLFAHSVPLLAPAATPFLSLCLEESGLQAVPSVAICGQPCAILHMAVQMAGLWLCDCPSDSGILLIGADQAYAPQERIYFGSAMGDVAFAAFISRAATHNYILASVSESDIIATQGEASPLDDITRFRSLNPLYIRHAIETCLSEAQTTLADLSYIVPHTPYNMIWDTMAELLRFPRQRILTDYLADTGHLNSNDSFVHYTRAVQDGLIRNGNLALLVNPGFGGTRGCTLIKH